MSSILFPKAAAQRFPVLLEDVESLISDARGDFSKLGAISQQHYDSFQNVRGRLDSVFDCLSKTDQGDFNAKYTKLLTSCDEYVDLYRYQGMVLDNIDLIDQKRRDYSEVPEKDLRRCFDECQENRRDLLVSFSSFKNNAKSLGLNVLSHDFPQTVRAELRRSSDFLKTIYADMEAYQAKRVVSPLRSDIEIAAPIDPQVTLRVAFNHSVSEIETSLENFLAACPFSERAERLAHLGEVLDRSILDLREDFEGSDFSISSEENRYEKAKSSISSLKGFLAGQAFD